MAKILFKQIDLAYSRAANKFSFLEKLLTLRINITRTGLGNTGLNSAA